MANPERGRPVDRLTLSDFRLSGAHHSVVLVVDGDALARNLVALVMQQEGHFVLSAANGDEGLELSRHYLGTIDLAITDVEMPERKGTDLCSHLLEERPEAKLLLMFSAHVKKADGQDVSIQFIPKPLDEDILRGRVRAVLGTPRLADDPTRLISELHSELREIDEEIGSLEHRQDGEPLTDEPETSS